MKLSFDQSAFWNGVIDKRTFGHPLNRQWVRKVGAFDASILDFGCGYGRSVAELQSLGYTNVRGVDSASNMIEQGRLKDASLNLSICNSETLPFADNTFDGVLLIAVLTCVPYNIDQAKIVKELWRVMKPKGVLYCSDLLLNTDQRNTERYNNFSNPNIPYGVFKLPDGAILRHHNQEYLKVLFQDFELVAEQDFEARTMNGNTANAIQLLWQK